MWKILKALPKSWRQKVCSPLGSSQCTDDPSVECNCGGNGEVGVQEVSDTEKCQNLVTCNAERSREVEPGEGQLTICVDLGIRCPASLLHDYYTQKRQSYARFCNWLEQHRQHARERLQTPRLVEALRVGITLLVVQKCEALGHLDKIQQQNLERRNARLYRSLARSIDYRNGFHIIHSVLPPSAVKGIQVAASQAQTSASTAKHGKQKVSQSRESTEEVLLANLERVTAEYTSHVLNAEAKKLTRQDEFVKAVQLFKAADDLGLAEAKYNLGVCYESGVGLEQNLTKAFQYYKEAADLGHSGASYNLAVFHLEGRGVPVNEMQGLEYMVKASYGDIKEAHTFMGIHYGQQADFARAAELFKRAADLQDASGQYYLGLCYENGLGVEESMATAVELYENASLGGSSEACYRLATCFEQGLGGLAENKVRAAELYQKAAASGHELASERLKWSLDDSSSPGDSYIIFEDSVSETKTEVTGQSLRMTKSSPELTRQYFSGSETAATSPSRSLKFDFTLIKELFKSFKEETASTKMLNLSRMDDDYLNESDHDPMHPASRRHTQTWDNLHSLTVI